MRKCYESRWIAVLLVAGCASVAGAAELTVEGRITQPSVQQPTGVPLYDQTDSPQGAGFASQDFEAASSTFDCQAADDFTIPAPDVGWDVSGVEVLGAYIVGSGPTPLLNVWFFTDAGGSPGAVVAGCGYTGLVAGVDFVDDGTGNLDVTLPTPCSLPAATYWVSVQADMDSTVGGQWIWGERSTQAGDLFQWQNPGDGFLTGCTSWTAGTSCGADGPDLLFSISGALVPVELQTFGVE